MKFGSIEYLWFFVSIPIVGGFFWYAWGKRNQLLQQFAKAPTLKLIQPKRSAALQLIRIGLILSALFFLTLALIRPQWGKEMQLVKRKGLDLLLVQDVSLSMLAEDISPNRLTRAQHEISAFLENLRGDRVGLLAFAGESQLLCPLTMDYGAMRLFLKDLNPYTIEPGTNLGAAMERGLEVFQSVEQRAAKYQVMVVLSDGEEHDPKALEVAKKAREQGINVYTVGIGSTEGVPIPIQTRKGKEYKKDARGQRVQTKLEEKSLQAIAQLTGGRYHHAKTGSFQLEQILKDLENRERREIEGKMFEQYKERFQIPLAIAILLLIWEGFLGVRRKEKKA